MFSTSVSKSVLISFTVFLILVLIYVVVGFEVDNFVYLT